MGTLTMWVGRLLITSAGVLAVVALGAGLRGRRGGLRTGLAGSLVCLAAAMALLVTALLNHDFRLDYVVRHTSLDLPAAYCFAALWAGQEGTVLLWSALLAAAGLLVLGGRPRAGQRATATTICAVMVGFLGLLLVRSPFALVEGAPPADGHGLNPLLRNPWMIVHPPVLFVGYALLVVPFAMALAAFYRGDVDAWVDEGRVWLLAGWLALGAGMMLGAYWAYITLGWGGFWAWDPVENSSLIPWMFATALLHGLVLQRRCGAFRVANYVLAMVTFGTVIYGSYLTRSGALGEFSVHSFESLGSEYNAVWLALVTAPFGAGLGLLVARRRQVSGGAVPPALGWLAQATWLLIAMAVFVLLGTSAPLVTALLGQPQAVEASFYNRTQTVFFIVVAVLLLLAVPPRGALLGTLTLSLALAAAAAAALVVAVPEPLSRAALVVLALATGAMMAVGGGKAVRGCRGRRPAEAGAGLAHLGMAALVLGAVLSSAGQRSETLHLTPGEQQASRVAGGPITFVRAEDRSDGKLALHLALGDPGRPGLALMYETPNGLMRHPVVYAGLARDLYLEPEAVESGADHAHGAAQEVTLTKGETKSVAGLQITFHDFDLGAHGEAGGMAVGARLTVSAGRVKQTVTPRYVITEEGRESPPEQVAGKLLAVTGITPGHGTVKGAVLLTVQAPGTGDAGVKLVLKVTSKPGIVLVWLGTLVLLAGGAAAALGRRPVEHV